MGYDFLHYGLAKGDFNGIGRPRPHLEEHLHGRTAIWYMTDATWNGGYADLLPTVTDPNWAIVGVRILMGIET